MKGAVVALGTIRNRCAAALVVDGKLEDLIVDPPEGTAPLPGTVFRGVADRPAKGLGGRFVRLGDGQTGFLRQGQLAAGRSALVQVTGYAEPGKAVPVSAKLTFRGRHAIVTPGAPGINVSRKVRDAARRASLSALVASAVPEAAGVILRSAAENADDDAVAAELATLQDQAARVLSADTGAPERLLDGPDAHHLARIDWDRATDICTDLAACGADEMIAAFLRPEVDLRQGGQAWIEPTRALVAIDVNTGADSSPAAGLKANIALARDLPRQLRCRGTGGQIVIDFAPFPKRDRRRVEDALRSAFRADCIETALVGWTPLGHFELQRKRARFPLAGQ